MDSSPPGGAGSARPQGRHRPGPDMSPVGHKPLASSSGEKGMPRHSFSLAMRTHRVRPSEKTTLRVVPGFTPRGLLARLAPPGGGAPPAREKKLAFYWAIPLRATSFLRTPPDNEGPPHPLGRATRAHRVRPSKKIPWRTSGRTARGPLFRARILEETSSSTNLVGPSTSANWEGC